MSFLLSSSFFFFLIFLWRVFNVSLWLGTLCKRSPRWSVLNKGAITIIIIYLVATVVICPTIHLVNYPSHFVPTNISSDIRVGLLSNLVKTTLVHDYHNQYHLRSWIASGTNCPSLSLLALRRHKKEENQRLNTGHPPFKKTILFVLL